VQDVSVTNCVVQNVDLNATVIRRGLVDGLRVRGWFAGQGVALDQVVLRGRVGSFHLTPFPLRDSLLARRAFSEANREFYASVEWALDITELSATGQLELTGVPAHLIRRDTASQGVVYRSRVETALGRLERASAQEIGKWVVAAEPRLGAASQWASQLANLFLYDCESVVIVAPKGAGATKFRKALDGLKAMGDLGIAE
jgi:hypothetical protein